MINAGPTLAVCTNFNQGFSSTRMAHINTLPSVDDRDGIYWDRVETTPGVYYFDATNNRSSYPQLVTGKVSITVNAGNPLYDGGFTPYTPEGIAAMAAFAVSIVQRHPNVDTIEVGNEFNGANFVSGPVLAAPNYSDARVAYYVAILNGIYDAVKAVRPDVLVIGGATHSIPSSWLWRMLDMGATMDALVLHPYTSTPEQGLKQIAVLRRHPAIAELPIQITEFGTTKINSAPAHFAKWYAVAALSGVSRMGWFASHSREGFAPIFETDGTRTLTGLAYVWAQENLTGLSASLVDAGIGAYAVKFGNRILAVWGEPRSLTLRNGAQAFNASGVLIPSPTITLDPIYIVSPVDLTFGSGKTVQFGETALIADSLHMFDYPVGNELQTPGDKFERFARRNGVVSPVITIQGQSRSGALWNPSRGIGTTVRLTEKSVISGNYTIHHRYTASERQKLLLRLEGAVMIMRGDAMVFKGPGTYPVECLAGDVIEFTLPTKSAFRITISKDTATGPVAPADTGKWNQGIRFARRAAR